VAPFDGLDLVLGLTQLEKKFLLCRCGADPHERPVAQDVFPDHGPYTPHSVGGQAKAAIWIETIDSADHADIPFGDQICERQTIAAEAGRDPYDQAEMAGNQAMCGIRVPVFPPAPGKPEFLAGLDQRKLLNV